MEGIERSRNRLWWKGTGSGYRGLRWNRRSRSASSTISADSSSAPFCNHGVYRERSEDSRQAANRRAGNRHDGDRFRRRQRHSAARAVTDGPVHFLAAEPATARNLAFEDSPERLGFDRAFEPERGRAPARPDARLTVHRWGMFIVESKSVTEEVRVRPDGSGGDEWTRVYRGTESGMSSPIQQARRQSEFLRTILRRHAGELLGKVAVGLRTATKFVAGTDQRGFKHAPIQLVIAVSDTKSYFPYFSQ